MGCNYLSLFNSKRQLNYISWITNFGNWVCVDVITYPHPNHYSGFANIGQQTRPHMTKVGDSNVIYFDVIQDSVKNLAVKGWNITPCIHNITVDIKGPFHWRGLTLIPAWISNHMLSKMWYEITYPFPNLYGATVEVWEWIRNFIPYFIYKGSNYLSMLGFKLMQVNKKGP